MVYCLGKPSREIITYASSDGMGFESGRSRVVQGWGGQRTCRPWLDVHVVYPVPDPSLIEHGKRQSTTQKATSLTLTREHSSEGVNWKEEHFRNLQSFGHRRIAVPKVHASTNLVRSLRSA